MDILQTIIIAIVEGLTEFLPVSSTGHMIIAQQLLAVPSTDFVKAFTIIIQFGAILSVVVLYWKRFVEHLHWDTLLALLKNINKVEYWKQFAESWSFYFKIMAAFIPAAILGFLFNKKIDALLENVYVVATMLVAGGVFMLFVDQWFNKPKEKQDLSYKNAFAIGLFQCIAMIPGVSRSMSTIVGGMTQGLTRKNAAEFSFFLAVPTMAAATGYKVFKLIFAENGTSLLMENMPTLIIGNVVAFVVAMLAIKFFIGYVTKYGFKLFGWYRIVLGLAILVFLLTGHNLSII